MLSDEALELLDGMVDLQLNAASSSATSSQLLNSLDIKDLHGFGEWLKELVSADYVRKRMPTSIRETVQYYVNMPRFRRLLAKLNGELDTTTEPVQTDWDAVKQEIVKLDDVLEQSDLSQSDRAQAGAVITSLKILVEAPDPPKKVIRDLLCDLAALATLFALALQIADKIK